MIMLEKAIYGGRRYWVWIFFLLGLISVGFLAYLYQFKTV